MEVNVSVVLRVLLSMFTVSYKLCSNDAGKWALDWKIDKAVLDAVLSGIWPPAPANASNATDTEVGQKGRDKTEMPRAKTNAFWHSLPSGYIGQEAGRRIWCRIPLTSKAATAGTAKLCQYGCKPGDAGTGKEKRGTVGTMYGHFISNHKDDIPAELFKDACKAIRFLIG